MAFHCRFMISQKGVWCAASYFEWAAYTFLSYAISQLLFMLLLYTAYHSTCILQWSTIMEFSFWLFLEWAHDYLSFYYLLPCNSFVKLIERKVLSHTYDRSHGICKEYMIIWDLGIYSQHLFTWPCVINV